MAVGVAHARARTSVSLELPWRLRETLCAAVVFRMLST